MNIMFNQFSKKAFNAMPSISQIYSKTKSTYYFHAVVPPPPIDFRNRFKLHYAVGGALVAKRKKDEEENSRKKRLKLKSFIDDEAVHSGDEDGGGDDGSGDESFVSNLIDDDTEVVDGLHDHMACYFSDDDSPARSPLLTPLPQREVDALFSSSPVAAPVFHDLPAKLVVQEQMVDVLEMEKDQIEEAEAKIEAEIDGDGHQAAELCFIPDNYEGVMLFSKVQTSHFTKFQNQNKLKLLKLQNFITKQFEFECFPGRTQLHRVGRRRS